MARRLCPSAVDIAGIAAIVMLVLGCRDSRGRLSNSEEAASPNKAAWQVALKAESEATFRDARYLLSQVDVTKLTDQDVREFIEYQRRFYGFCIQVGVPRDVKMDIQSVLSGINYKTVAQTLIDKGITKAHQEAKRLTDEGAALAAGLDKHLDVRKLLVRRYGPPNS
jgi:hypothetical protein